MYILTLFMSLSTSFVASRILSFKIGNRNKNIQKYKSVCVNKTAVLLLGISVHFWLYLVKLRWDMLSTLKLHTVRNLHFMLFSYSLYSSIHPSIHQWLYGPFVGPWPFFQFCNPIHSRKGSLGGGSARLRPLHTHRTNANRHPCLEWDSNPRPQYPGRRRRFMSHTARPPWSPIFCTVHFKYMNKIRFWLHAGKFLFRF
jgi:hypothetical protein